VNWHTKKPWKIGLSTHISLYSGFADPLSFSCKCGFKRDLDARGVASYQRENQKKGELWQQQK